MRGDDPTQELGGTEAVARVVIAGGRFGPVLGVQFLKHWCNPARGRLVIVDDEMVPRKED